MIRGNCSSVHTVNTRIKKYFDSMSLEEARFMNRCYRHVLSGAKGYFTRSVFLVRVRYYHHLSLTLCQR